MKFSMETESDWLSKLLKVASAVNSTDGMISFKIRKNSIKSYWDFIGNTIVVLVDIPTTACSKYIFEGDMDVTFSAQETGKIISKMKGTVTFEVDDEKVTIKATGKQFSIRLYAEKKRETTLEEMEDMIEQAGSKLPVKCKIQTDSIDEIIADMKTIGMEFLVIAGNQDGMKAKGADANSVRNYSFDLSMTPFDKCVTKLQVAYLEKVVDALLGKETFLETANDMPVSLTSFSDKNVKVKAVICPCVQEGGGEDG